MKLYELFSKVNSKILSKGDVLVSPKGIPVEFIEEIEGKVKFKSIVTDNIVSYDLSSISEFYVLPRKFVEVVNSMRFKYWCLVRGEEVWNVIYDLPEVPEENLGREIRRERRRKRKERLLKEKIKERLKTKQEV